MIRQARAKDLMAVEKLLSEFYSRAPLCDIPYDRGSSLDLILRMILGKNSVILVHEKDNKVGGMIAGQNFIFPLNNNYFHLVESFWYSNDGSGFRLLSEFEKIAKDLGAHSVLLSTIHALHSDRLNRIIHKKGYKKLETNHIKEIK